ncbi:MAG: helix-turn-helix domain containing protein [Candidatus Aminicenantes bacterium]|nr:helix-turn-helix domain containing protein [Candidatus Aminicenantes bacterium]
MGVKERREREEGARLAAIIVAAERVFMERGYFHARMEDIAEAAELAKGTIYYYFKSKDEIFVHILEREARKIHAEITRRMAGTNSFLGLLELWIDFYLEYFEKNQGYLRMFLPCMGGVIRFEDKAAGRKLLRNAEQWRDLRETFKAQIGGERLPFELGEIMKFLKTLQIGMGLKLLEGDKAEARAAGRFFLEMMKRVMEAKS